MENFLSADKVKVILNNAPKGSDPGRVIQALVDKGYKLEGFNDKPEPLPKPSRYEVAMGKKNPDGTDNTDKGIIPQAVDQFKKGFKQTQEGAKNPNLIEGTVQIGKGILNEAAGGIRAVFSPIEAGMKIISKLPVIHQALGGVDKSVDYFADKISNNKKLQKFAMENPDADEVIANLVTIGLSVAAGKDGAPNGVPATRVSGIIDSVLKDVSTKSPEVLRNTITKFKEKTAPVAEKVKEKMAGESEADIAGKIFQAKPEKLDTMVRALEGIDKKGIKSSEDLFSRLDTKAKENTLAVDEALQKSTDVYKPADITKTIEVKGGKPLKQDFVQTALDHLKELYEKTSDPTSQAKIMEKITKYQKDGLTAHEMNLIAREYGSEFGSKAFSKASGDPLTSVNAQSYENVRSGIKGTVREKMPDAGTKALDMNTSDSLDAMKLLKNVETKAQQAANKLEKAGLIQKMGGLFGKGVDIATGGFVKGMLKTLFNKVGTGMDESLGAIQIKEGIPKLIKAFEKVEKIKDLKAKGVESQLKEIFKDFIPGNKTSKSNSETIYRGGTTNGKYFSTSKTVAQDFAKNRGGSVSEHTLNPNAKIINYEDIPTAQYKGINDYNMEKYGSGKDLLSFQNGKLEADYIKAENWAKQNGYDVVKFPTEGEVRIINTKSVISKTKTPTKTKPVKVNTKLKGNYLNIGMKVGKSGKITSKQITDGLKKFGAKLVKKTIKNSGTEPTMIVRLSKPLSEQDLMSLSKLLKQDAIPQLSNGVGIMSGPKAAKWGDFNPEYFLGFNGKPININSKIIKKK